MGRRLYSWLVRAHPAAFRERFGREMVEGFDGTTGAGAKLLLAADAVISLVRQWGFRAEFREEPIAMAPSQGPHGEPLFRGIEGYRPSRVALLLGGLLTVAALTIAGDLERTGGKAKAFLIGVFHPSPHLLSVDRTSVAGANLNTTVTLGTDPEDPLRAVTAAYFRVVRVLEALDADRDLAISQWEMMTAPAALRRIDANHDGKLSAEECGFRAGGMPREQAERAAREFMRVNPVLAALDANHDGEISAAEIANSTTALRKLAGNHYGSLTAAELIPEKAAMQAGFVMALLDSNGDGVISGAELESEDADRMREFLRAADANRNGRITRMELVREIRRRTEAGKELQETKKAAGIQ